MSKIRVLVADDHPLFVNGLSSLIATDSMMELSCTASNGNEVIAQLGKGGVDICVIDISMPEMDGIAALKEIRKRNYSCKVIMLTTFDDIEMIRTVVALKADGYVLKSSTGSDLLNAIRKVSTGEKYFSPEVKDAIANDFLHHQPKDQTLLTPREIEVVRLLAKEHTNDEIADKLFISYRTVETHRKNIMHKTKSKNLAGLIQYANAAGILK